MSSIDTAPAPETQNSPEGLAHALFDAILTPAAEARRADGLGGYFPRAPARDAVSYFDGSGTRAQDLDFEFPGGGDADGLIDALSERWTREGETRLVNLAPGLKAIAQALAAEGEGDGSVDPYCYTMF